MNDSKRTALLDWLPVVVSYVGLLLLIAAAVFWALTNRVEPLLLTAFGTMMTFGEAGRFARSVSKSTDS